MNQIERQHREEDIASLILDLPPVRFVPAAYFLADCGVITLVWTGFPDPIVSLREKLADRLPGLPAETRGSKWSKTTLAVRRSSKPLSRSEAFVLVNVLKQANTILVNDIRLLSVESLSLIEYGDRALQRWYSDVTLPVDLTRSPDYGINPTSAEYVTILLGAAIEERLPGVSRKAHDLDYYDTPCRESTLAIDCSRWSHPSLDFLRSRIDDQMADRYHWIASRARHITVRNLGPTESSYSA